MYYKYLWSITKSIVVEYPQLNGYLKNHFEDQTVLKEGHVSLAFGKNIHFTNYLLYQFTLHQPVVKG